MDKNNHLKMYLLLKMVVFHCYVSLPEGISSHRLKSTGPGTRGYLSKPQGPATSLAKCLNLGIPSRPIQGTNRHASKLCRRTCLEYTIRYRFPHQNLHLKTKKQLQLYLAGQTNIMMLYQNMSIVFGVKHIIYQMEKIPQKKTQLLCLTFRFRSLSLWRYVTWFDHFVRQWNVEIPNSVNVHLEEVIDKWPQVALTNPKRHFNKRRATSQSILELFLTHIVILKSSQL